MPTASSITTSFGSISPLASEKAFADGIAKAERMTAIAIPEKGETAASHAKGNAAMLPAVPGAKGKYPAPPKVANVLNKNEVSRVSFICDSSVQPQYN